MLIPIVILLYVRGSSPGPTRSRPRHVDEEHLHALGSLLAREVLEVAAPGTDTDRDGHVVPLAGAGYVDPDHLPGLGRARMVLVRIEQLVVAR